MKIPTKESIDAANRLRNEQLSWEPIDNLLYSEFKRLRENVNQRDVAYKVTLLNKLYNCGLRADAQDVAKLIVDAKIDERLHKGDPVSLVEEIANLNIQKAGKRKRANLGPVFTSKYCHFHQPDRFAIYDQYARCALEELLERKVPERKYSPFKSGVDALISKIGLPLTYKDIDGYLWIYGQWLHHQRGETIGWIRNAISLHRELFSKLAPS